MHASQRCSAKSKRSGVKCKAPAVRGWSVCRMHGARGGGPRGVAHGQYRHGIYCVEVKADRAIFRALMGDARETIGRLKQFPD